MWWRGALGIFGYYDVMAADGSVLTTLEPRLKWPLCDQKEGGKSCCEEQWQQLIAPVLLHHPAPAPLGKSTSAPGTARCGVRRARSKSPEHQEQCAERFGSKREARRQCARCGWIANRERRGVSGSQVLVLGVPCVEKGHGRPRRTGS